MARDWYINGDAMVKVRSAPLAINPLVDASLHEELGLALDDIRVIPRYVHHGMFADDFGQDTAPDVAWGMADVEIRMTLVHFDIDVLRRCVMLSAGHDTSVSNDQYEQPTDLGRAGRMLGNNRELYTTGNNYIRMVILSSRGNLPWAFHACYLEKFPMVLTLGTKPSEVELHWRAVPYRKTTTRAATAEEVAAFGRLERTGDRHAGYNVAPVELTSHKLSIWEHSTE